MKVKNNIRKLAICFLSLCLVSCAFLFYFFNNKVYSQDALCDDYALALTDYEVGTGVIKVTAPNGENVQVNGGKIFLASVGNYVIQYIAEEKTVGSLYDYPTVNFAFDETLKPQYAVGSSFRIPLATITSAIGSYNTYEVEIKCNNETLQTYKSGALQDEVFTVNKKGNYKIIYSCKDEYTLSYTATKTIKFSTNNDTLLVFNELPERISYGEEISFGAIYALSNSETYSAELKVTTPSGNTEKIEDITYIPKEEGTYIFTAFADVNGSLLEKSQTVDVIYSTRGIFTNLQAIGEVKEYQNLPSYSDKKGKSVFISAQNSNSSFYVSNLIDLTKLKDTPLIEFVPYSDVDSLKSNTVRISLIDAYNSSNTLQIIWWYKADVSYESYITTMIRGKQYGGICNEKNSSFGNVRKDSYSTLPYAYGTVAFGCNFNAYNNGLKSIPFNFIYNYDENALYTKTSQNDKNLTLIMDYDNTDYVSYSDIWNGFTNNLIYLKFEFLGDDPIMGAFIKSVCGKELNEEVLSEPKDENCFILNTDNIPNKAIINKDFVIPTYIVNNLSKNTVVSVSVLKDGEEINNLINDGKFKASELGTYTIKYTANDKYGQEVVKTFEIEVIDGESIVIQDIKSKFLSTKIFDNYIIPDVSITGGIGNINIDKKVCVNDNVISQNGLAFIDQIGNYQLIVTATDYVGNIQERTFDLVVDYDYVSIKLNENIISLRAGVEEKLPDFETYDYLNQETPEKQIEVYDTKGNKIGQTLTAPFKFSVPEGYDYLTLKYIAKGKTRTTYKEFTVKVLPKTISKISDAILFDGSMVELTNGVVFENDKTNNLVKFPKALPADNLKIIFGMFTASLENLDKITLTLTDAGDENLKVNFVFSDFNAGVAKLVINNDGRAFKANFVSENVKKNEKTYANEEFYGLTCLVDNVLLKLNYGTGKEIGSIIKDANGNTFVGFTSGLVFVEIKTDVKTGTTVKTIIKTVSNQVLSSLLPDNQGPNILYSKRMTDGRYVYGTKLVVSSAKAYDLIQSNSTVSVKITAPNGSVIYNGDIDKDYELTLSQYGKYKITYTAQDGVATNTKDYNITVYGDKMPEINVSQNINKQYNAGSTLTIPSATAKSKNGNEASLNVKVYLIDSLGKYTTRTLGENIELKQKGVYYLVYTVEDEFNNLSRISYRFTVK